MYLSVPVLLLGLELNVEGEKKEAIDELEKSFTTSPFYYRFCAADNRRALFFIMVRKLSSLLSLVKNAKE